MRIKNSFILREIAGEYVIVPSGNTAKTFNGLISSNESGVFLWKKLQDEISESELLRAFTEEYEVDEETARQDIRDFLDVLSKNDILSE